MNLALLLGDGFYVQSVHIAQPKPAELLLRKLAPDADHSLSNISLFCLLFDSSFDDDLRTVYYAGPLRQTHRVVVLHMVAFLFIMVVTIGPCFPSKKIGFRVKVRAGQADDMFIGISVNDGLMVLFVQGVDASPIWHLFYLHSDCCLI